MYKQSGTSQKFSPITPVVPAPPSEIPGFLIEPSAVFTRGRQLVVQFGGLIGFLGSRLGTNHGFTQRGCTGVMVPVVWLPKAPEFEGLKASAVGVALTLFPLFPKCGRKTWEGSHVSPAQ